MLLFWWRRNKSHEHQWSLNRVATDQIEDWSFTTTLWRQDPLPKSKLNYILTNKQINIGLKFAWDCDNDTQSAVKWKAVLFAKNVFIWLFFTLKNGQNTSIFLYDNLKCTFCFVLFFFFFLSHRAKQIHQLATNWLIFDRSRLWPPRWWTGGDMIFSISYFLVR